MTTTVEHAPYEKVEATWSIDRLIPYEGNAKKHEAGQVNKIAASMRAHGWTTRIVVEEDGTIIAGHGRRLAAIQNSYAKVPVVILKGISKEQAKALRLIDNKVQEGGYDTALLSEELRSLVLDDGLDLSDWFDTRDLEFAIEDLGEIDLDSLSADISLEVSEQTNKTQAEIESADADTVSVTQVFGFKHVTSEQKRVLTRFMSEIETDTGLKGADALCAFARALAGEEAGV